MEDREPAKIMTESNGGVLPQPEAPVLRSGAEETSALPTPPAAQQQDLPKLTLIQAGLTVFDGVL
ncbi:MAG: hypothetical protein L0387_05355, partial [Acidobacteria bacterium]|nr:hypothetical protein [Acidobacteriota bacterium]